MAISNVPLAVAGPHVEDVMLRDPRTLAPDTTVGEARAMFENDRVRLLLIAREGEFVGAITRESLPADAGDDEQLEAHAGADVALVSPGDPVARAVELLDERATDRIPVVDDGALVGLVCFNRRHGHFCVSS